MTAVVARVAPPNSLLLVMDSSGGEVPQAMRGRLVAATESCIAVGCKSEIDGETEIILGLAREVDPGRSAEFQEALETPSRRVSVKSALGFQLLEIPTSSKETLVRIWVNHREEPDKIIVGIVD